VNVTVATNSTYGYSVSLEDTDNNTDLISETLENNDKFESNFTETVTSSTMPENSWGYSLNATDFYEIVPFGMPDLIGKSNEATTSESENATTRVDFGAKIGDFTIADQYSDQILFTAYVNGQDGTAYRINDEGSTDEKLLNNPYTPTYNMQSFECETLNIGQSAKAIDTRDNNKYIIKRLSNGACWMTSSLKIKNKTLTPEDSDVTSNFVLRDSGDISEFIPDENTNSKTVDVVYDNDGSVFYSWHTATAGDSANAISFENPDEIQGNSMVESLKTLNSSICPKGWRLPSIADYPMDSSSARSFDLKLPIDGTIFNGTYEFRTISTHYSDGETTKETEIIDTRGNASDSHYRNFAFSLYWSSSYVGVMENYIMIPPAAARMYERVNGEYIPNERFGALEHFPIMLSDNEIGDNLRESFDYDKIVVGAHVVCLTGNSASANNGEDI
jgi:uncharacterized protein (TIGR02145 family)